MLVEKTVREFVTELGSDSPAPGGGSASALAGALSAALTSMVCRLTVNNAKYSGVQSEMNVILEQSSTLTRILLGYVDEDAQTFNGVMAAYKLPKTTDQERRWRSEAVQGATKQAATLPLKVAEACLDVLTLARRVLRIGNVNAASDAGVSGLMAYAGMNGAIYNISINLGTIKDEQFVAQMQGKIDTIRQQACPLYQQLLVDVEKLIG